MDPLRIVFLGTPDFAVASLDALIAAGHHLVQVVTQPPRPAGRGKTRQPTPVQLAATAAGLPVRCPATLKDPAVAADLAALDADVLVVVAYGLILPRAFLDLARLGAVNVHASLLPRWRGAAPIQRAILAGDTETGVTIMQLEAGLDTGPMLAQARVEIGPRTTAGELHDRLAALGAGLLAETVADLARGRVTPRPQPAEGVTYAAKIAKAEGEIQWRRPAPDLDRLIRALSPWPGAFCRLGGERVKVHLAEPVPGTGAPGTILDDRLTVACGEAALRLVRLQRPGRQPLAATEFLRGRPVPAGTVLG